MLFRSYHNLENEKGEKLIAGWQKIYETLKDTDWRSNPEKVAADHEALLKQYVAPTGIKGKRGGGVHETDLVRLMNLFEDTFGRGGRPFTTFPWAHGNRQWHSPMYNLPRTPVEGQYGADDAAEQRQCQDKQGQRCNQTGRGPPARGRRLIRGGNTHD